MAYTPCANGCDFSLPARNAAELCEIFNDNLIQEIRLGYFGKPLVSPLPEVGATPAQETARSTEWAARLDNEADRTAEPNAIRFYTVPDWQLPRTDPVTKTTASGKLIGAAVTPREITGVIDDDSDETYRFWSEFSACPRTVLLWFNSGGHTYGGQDGLEATVLATYGITTDGVSHAWSIRITYSQRGSLQRHKLLV